MTDLMKQFHELSLQKVVEDTEQYALEFRKLAAGFRARNCNSMAELCDAKAKQYENLSASMPGYRRVQEAGYVMLEAVV